MVKPLELVVVVIFLFTVPQIIGLTPRFRDQSKSLYVQGWRGNAAAALPCELVIELVMAFRAPVLAAVYLCRTRRSDPRPLASRCPFARSGGTLPAAAAEVGRWRTEGYGSRTTRLT